MEIMKFNYEFEFNIDNFVEWAEEDYLDDDYEENEKLDKAWLRDKLYYYIEDTDSIPLLIIREDIVDYDGKNYASKIVDRAYEILEEKRVELKEEKKKEEKEEVMEHLRSIRDYCEKQCDCFDCPIQKICERSINIGEWRIK